MNDLRELYREVILDHNRHPRNFGELQNPDKIIEGVNPLCGDRMTLYVKMENKKIQDISFKGTGCAISVASSSLMTEKAKGSLFEEIDALFEHVHEMLTGDPTAAASNLDALDKLTALSGVREYPTRVKCATLAWHALKNAIVGSDDKISTE